MYKIVIRKIYYTINQILRNFRTFIQKEKIEKKLKKRFLGLYIETTNICNADCIFCAYQHQKRDTGVMDDLLFKKLIDEYVELGGGNLGLTPTVGDPLVDKNIINKIKYARSFKEIKEIGMYSNLISLSLFNLNDFVNSGLNHLAVSTSGFDENMYKRVYRSNQYSRMYNNLINLLIENKKNNSPIDISVDMRSDLSLKETLSLKDYKKILNYISEEKCGYKFRYDDWAGKIKPTDLTGVMRIRNMFASLRFRFSACFEYFNGPMIYWNGDVGICGCRDVDAKELIIGNAKNNSLKEIWYNEKHLNYLDNFNKNTPSICKTCTHYDNISVLQSPAWKVTIQEKKEVF